MPGPPTDGDRQVVDCIRVLVTLVHQVAHEGECGQGLALVAGCPPLAQDHTPHNL